jgi:hypothetical protein
VKNYKKVSDREPLGRQLLVAAKNRREIQAAGVSNRGTAKALGVDEITVRRDVTQPAANVAPPSSNPAPLLGGEDAPATNVAPPFAQAGGKAAQVATKAAETAHLKPAPTGCASCSRER